MNFTAMAPNTTEVLNTSTMDYIEEDASDEYAAYIYWLAETIFVSVFPIILVVGKTFAPYLYQCFPSSW